MPVPSEYDAVKAEKADAMRRYTKRKKHLQVAYCFLRLLPCLLIFLCLSFPLSVPNSISDILSSSQYYFNFSYIKTGRSQNLLAFLLLNAIVFAVYLLSTSTSTSPDRREPASSDLYGQCVSLSSACRNKPEEENAPCRQLTAAVDEGVRDDRRVVARRRYRRTKSEASAVTAGEEKEEEEKKALRKRRMTRSETENGRELAVVVGTSGVGGEERKSMEEMNNDEFRMAIEKFIASKRRVLMEETHTLPDQQ